MAKELKGEIRYKNTLTEEQKEVKRGVYEKDVSIVLGNFGSGKTYVAAQVALDLLFKRIVNKIYITRPIDFSTTGYFPGSASEKMSFHIFPIKQNFYSAHNKEKVDKLFEEERIEIVPIDYLKGYTVSNAVMIIDEFEDITLQEFKLILSRLGKDSKMIFTGSKEQIGIKNSCIPVVEKLQNCDKVSYNVLTSQHRNPVLSEIFSFLE